MNAGSAKIRNRAFAILLANPQQAMVQNIHYSVRLETGNNPNTERAMTKLTGFQEDIRPLFTERDIHAMSKAFNLAS
jgi:hypothetical protein